MAEADGIIVAGELRALFPSLFEPRRVKRGGKEIGEPIYSSSFLMDPSGQAAAELKAKAVEVARAKWPNRNLSELKFPFADGNAMKARLEKQDRDQGKKLRDYSFYEGNLVLKTKSQFEPGVVGPNKKPVMDRSTIYSGCYCYAEVNFVAYDGIDQNPDGVTCYLNHFMKTRDGQRIAGRSAEDVFKGVSAPGAANGQQAGGIDFGGPDFNDANAPEPWDFNDEIPY